jgi:hypothetical protein
VAKWSGVLIVAAHRDMIHRMGETADRAKVEPVGVDLVPFALIRAVGQDEGHGLEESNAGGGFFTTLGGEEPLEQAAPTPSPSPPPVPAVPGTEGHQFAGTFELVSVSGNCARFLFGDESFSLCQGEAPT